MTDTKAQAAARAIILKYTPADFPTHAVDAMLEALKPILKTPTAPRAAAGTTGAKQYAHRVPKLSDKAHVKTQQRWAALVADAVEKPGAFEREHAYRVACEVGRTAEGVLVAWGIVGRVDS